jgi:tRNA A37 threonylcarbamoyladenosine biosynthesis protein TsaE
MDFYRMQEMENIQKLSLEHYLDKANLWLIEWPELFLNFLQNNPEWSKMMGFQKAINIEFLINENIRKLKFSEIVIDS